MEATDSVVKTGCGSLLTVLSSLARFAFLLSVAMSAAGCYPGYRISVHNQSDADIVLRIEGFGYTVPPHSHEMAYSGNGGPIGLIRLMKLDGCHLRSSFDDLRPGSYEITVPSDGRATIGPEVGPEPSDWYLSTEECP